MYATSRVVRHVFLAMMFLGLTSSATLGATPAIWVGTSGDWSNAADWSTDPFFPNNGNGAPTYAAVINSGVVNLDLDITLTQLSLGGGTLNGSGSLVVDLLTLSKGSLATTGLIISNQINLTGGVLDRDLNLSGTLNTIENVNIAAGRTLTNDISSILTAPSGPGERQAFGAGSFINKGTLVKTGNTRSYLSMAIANNLGDVEVQQGQLRFDQAGEHTGTFEVSSNAQLELRGTQDFASTASISGAGTLAILGGIATIDSDVTVGFLHLNGGTLRGTGNLAPTSISLQSGVLDRDLTLSGTLNTIENVNIAAGRTLTNDIGSILTAPSGPGERQAFGAGSFINEGTLLKTGNTRSYLSMATANNLGTVEVQQGQLRFDQSGDHTGTFEVASNAQLELRGTQNFAATASISGEGTLAILGGIATIDSEVSVGFLHLDGGTLRGTGNLAPTLISLQSGVLDSDLTLYGTLNTIENVNVAAGRTLTNAIGSILTAPSGPGERQAFGAGCFINKGTLVKTGNTRSYMSMAIANNLGSVEVQQGQLRFDQSGDHTGTFEVANGAQLELRGTQNFAATASISGEGTLAILGGIATIDSEVSVGFLHLNGGTLRGTGNLAPTLISLQSGVLDRDLNLGGTLNTIENVNIAAGRTLTNDIGSILTAPSGPEERQAFGEGSFINKGTLVKTGNTRSYMSIATANNLGDVEVQQGQLRFDQSGDHTGTFEVASGAQLEFRGTQNFAATASISGAGTLAILGGIATIDSEVSTSLVTVAGGVLSGNGTIEAFTSVDTSLSGIAPGDGIGTLTFESGLRFRDQAKFYWDLAALDTTEPGTNWDQIIITGGELTLGSVNDLVINFLDSDLSPIFGDEFWNTSHRWSGIIHLTDTAEGIAGDPNFLVDNTGWATLGAFHVETSFGGKGLDLVWTVPEVSTLGLSGAAALAAVGVSFRLRKRSLARNLD